MQEPSKAAPTVQIQVRPAQPQESEVESGGESKTYALLTALAVSSTLPWLLLNAHELGPEITASFAAIAALTLGFLVGRIT